MRIANAAAKERESEAVGLGEPKGPAKAMGPRKGLNAPGICQPGPTPP